MSTFLSPAAITTRPVAKRVRIDTDRFWVDLADGRVLGVPYARFPLLARASAEQRQAFVLDKMGRSVHWPAIDEDISIELLFYYTPSSK
jgi:hypothetical protein